MPGCRRWQQIALPYGDQSLTNRLGMGTVWLVSRLVDPPSHGSKSGALRPALRRFMSTVFEATTTADLRWLSASVILKDLQLESLRESSRRHASPATAGFVASTRLRHQLLHFLRWCQASGIWPAMINPLTVFGEVTTDAR